MTSLYLSKFLKILIVVVLLIVVCVEKPPPKLLIVQSASQIGGHLGLYWNGTIYLAPGATWEVFQHELNHHYYGSVGETPTKF